jgi:soluble cytochrome b562
MLSVIEAIGLHFQKELPGYSLELATSFELIYLDINRYGQYIQNPTKELLEKQILQIVEVPELKDRYPKDDKCGINLQQYLSNTYLYFGDDIKAKCNDVCDYLYSFTENNVENAHDYLQIQKMDMRNATYTQVDEKTILVETEITGEAKKIIQQKEKMDEPVSEIQKMISIAMKTVEEGSPDISSINETVDLLVEIIQRDEALGFQYENVLVHYIAMLLVSKNLEPERKDYLCDIWLNGLEKYFTNGSFVADIKLVPVLLEQLKANVSEKVKNDIRTLMLDSILYREHNGLISKVAEFSKQILLGDKDLARRMFNTIVMLSEDEMNHQKYNAEYIRTSDRDAEFTFVPNKQLKLRGVDHYIIDDNAKSYESQKNTIIEEYLLGDRTLDYSAFEMDNYDVGMLCYVSNCGLDFTDVHFEIVMKAIIKGMLDIWNSLRASNDIHEIIDVYHVHEVVELFQREIVLNDENAEKAEKAEKAIDLLFNDIDFLKFTREAVELYQDIFGLFLCVYVDGYKYESKRTSVERKLKYLGIRVDSILEGWVRTELFKSLVLARTRYYNWDVRKVKTEYSYKDKMFLNDQVKKYGKIHVKEVVETVYMLNMDKLLPEVLVSLNDCFSKAIQENIDNFTKSISEVQWIIDILILKAFIYHSDGIKNDYELTEAFEGVLDSMMVLNNEKAAVIIDEFRIH